jgi:hypothetical protein
MLATIHSRTFCLLICCLETKIVIYRTIIVLVVPYGYETWALALREEHRLRVLRRILGQKRDELTKDWRQLHNEGHHNL